MAMMVTVMIMMMIMMMVMMMLMKSPAFPLLSKTARALEQIGPKYLAPPERLQSSATGGAPEPVLGARCEKPPGRSIRSAPSGGPSSGAA